MVIYTKENLVEIQVNFCGILYILNYVKYRKMTLFLMMMEKRWKIQVLNSLFCKIGKNLNKIIILLPNIKLKTPRIISDSIYLFLTDLF